MVIHAARPPMPIVVPQRQPARNLELALSAAHLQLVLASNPSLSVAGAERVSQIAAGLSSALDITPSSALQLVSKRPALLHAAPEDALAACDRLAAAMSLAGGRPHAIRAVLRQPVLLDLAPEELSVQASRMAAVMGVDKGEAASMLYRTNGDVACLSALLAMPSNTMRQQLIDIQTVMDSR